MCNFTVVELRDRVAGQVNCLGCGVPVPSGADENPANLPAWTAAGGDDV